VLTGLTPGLPNANYFPFDTLEGKVALPDRFKPTPNLVTESTRGSKITSERVVVPHDADIDDLSLRIDLTTALQYGQAQGYPPLYTWLKDFTINALHPNIPYRDGPDIVLTVGSTDGLSKTLQTFSNEWHDGMPISEKAGMLVEKFAYMSAVSQAAPRGINIVPVEIDTEGMLAEGPGALKDVLENWDESRGRRPHLMYTVT
jgi:DNA-binding transcriptional MocR family regulator